MDKSFLQPKFSIYSVQDSPPLLLTLSVSLVHNYVDGAENKSVIKLHVPQTFTMYVHVCTCTIHLTPENV